MAITAGELAMVLTAKNEMSSVLKTVQGDMADTQKHGLNLGKVLGGALAGGAALAVGATVAVGKALYDAGKAAAEEEIGVVRLAAAVNAAGGSWEAAEEAIEGYIGAQQRRTGFDDGDARQALTNLTTTTGDYKESLDLLPLAMDLARAKNMDLSAAADIVGKVAAGNTGILSRYGIVLEEGATATEALGMMHERFAGQAEAYGKTYQGQMDILNGALGNLKETVGSAVLPIMTALATKLADIANDAIPFLENAIEDIRPAFDDIMRTLERDVFPVLEELWDWFMDWLPEAIEDYSEYLTEVAVPAMKAIWKFIEQNLIPIFRDMAEWLQDELPPAIEDLAEFWEEELLPAIKAVWRFIDGDLIPLLETIAGWLSRNVPDAVEDTGDAFEAMGRFLENARDTIVDAAETIKRWFTDTIPDAVGDMRDKVKGAVKNVTDAFYDKFTDTMDRLNPKWREDWEQIKEAAGDKIEEARQAIAGTVLAIKGKVSEVVGDIKEAWSRKWNEIKEVLADIGGPLLRAAQNAFGPVSSAISETAGSIKGFFTNIDWGGVGRGIIEGVGSGIRNAAGWLGEQAANAAAAALNAVKAFLGISSPSTVAAQTIGIPFMEGIALGMSQGAPELMETVADVMGSMVDVAESLTSLGGYQQQSGIGSIVDTFIADTREAGRRLVAFFNLWKEQTFENVKNAGQASALLEDMFSPVEDWIDGLVAIGQYEKAANLGQTTADLVADTREAGKLLMQFFKLWHDSTFENVAMGAAAAEALEGLFEPVADLVDSLTDIAEYQKAANIVQSVTDMIADARAAGKALVTYFQIWTESTFTNVGTATVAAEAMAALFEPAGDLVDGITAIGEYQKGADIVTVTSELIADARAAGKILVGYFRLWSDNTFGNVATATGAAEAMGGMFDAIGDMADTLVDITEIETIQPEAMQAKIGVLTQFADAFMAAITYVRTQVQAAMVQIQTLPAVYSGALGGAAGIVAGLGNFIQQLAGAVSAQGANFINAWSNLAWSAANGFKNGFSPDVLASLWQRVIDQARAILNDGIFVALGRSNAQAYKAGFEGAMQIASPSQVAVNWGKQIAAGLSQGMTSNVTNNYNLNVTTTQPAVGVVASFNMMGAMA